MTDSTRSLSFYQQAHFLLSAPSLKHCPPDSGAEIAFAGRSNVGKSSTLNTLTQQKKLARISKTPGRTQAINFFTLDDDHRLVDLPGYGFAKVPMAMQRHWQKSMHDYLTQRESLRALVIIMDCRHPLKDTDCQLVDWANSVALPVHVVLNKADKLSKQQANRALQTVTRELATRQTHDAGEQTVQLFSAHTKQGLAPLAQVLDNLFER